MCTNLATTEGYGLLPYSANCEWLKYLEEYEQPEFVVSGRELPNQATDKDKSFTYILSLEGGILNCNQPLLNNTEVKLSFDRALASVGLLYRKIGSDIVQPTTLDNKPLDITDPYIEVEYVSSPYLRNFYAQIEDRPVTMRYDDCNIYMKTINKDQSMIRVSNIMGGLTPDYLFAGMVQTDALNGDFLQSSTRFFDPDYREICITLNGMPVQGYPMSLDENGVKLYYKFLDTIGRTKKSLAGSTIDFRFFKGCYCFIGHHFEGEATNEGWIGLDIKLNKALAADATLGT